MLIYERMLCWSALDTLSVTTLIIDSSYISAFPSNRPSNRIAADVCFHVVQTLGTLNCERSSATPIDA